MPRLLAECGVAPIRVLGAAGLTPEALSRPDRRVGFAASARALNEAVQATGCEHFGLVAGREARLADLGFLGALTRRSATLGDALRAFVAHHHLVCTGGAAFLQEDAPIVAFGYAVFDPSVDHLGPVLDYAAAAGVGLLRELCGPQWNPGEVLLPHRPPADAGPYRVFFGCPVRFDAEQCEVRFPAGAMNRALPAPPETRRCLTPIPGDAASAGDDLLAHLYRAARLALLQGEADGERMAAELGLSRRTLGRRLQARGWSFQRVLDDVRHSVARELLEDTDLQVVDIALTLGYAEASPFVRAFRRWSGVAPLCWRQAHRTQAPEGGYAGRAAALRRA